MNRLNNLINRLCPDGVVYFQLSYLADIGTGRHNTNEGLNEGEFPFFVRSQEVRRLNDYDYDEAAIITSGDGVGVGKIFHYINGKYALHQRAYRIHITDSRLNVRFLFHYMKATFFEYIQKTAVNSSVTSVRRPMLNRYPVPVPPLEVQREIVRILDSFTTLTEDLTVELTKELTARKKQYEYYRNELLTSKIVDYSSSRLFEISEIYDGTHQTPEYKQEGVPFISVENINDIYTSSKYISVDAYNKYKIKPKVNDVFMTRIGSIGKCAIMKKNTDLAYYVSLALIRPNGEILDSRYLKHYIESSLGSKELSKRTLHNAVPIKINKDDIGKIIIKYPKLQVQKKIADVLDNFEKICNDLNIGLPAEIEARKKQYEYYRDVLLTFAETGSTILTDRPTDRP